MPEITAGHLLSHWTDPKDDKNVDPCVDQFESQIPNKLR